MEIEKLKIRKALAEDVDLLFNWSNDRLVRQLSFNSKEIPYDSHCQWYSDKLKNKNTLIFIIEMDGVAVGIVRFEIEEDVAVIGFSIDKSFRGQGLGKRILLMGIAEYIEHSSKPVLAVIKNENIASIKSFKKAGFEFYKEELIDEVPSVVYQFINEKQ